MSKLALIFFFVIFGLTASGQPGIPPVCEQHLTRKHFFISGDSLNCIGQIAGFHAGSLILGRYKPAAASLENGLMMKLDSAGQLIWSKSFLTNTTGEQLHFIRGLRLGSDEFLVTGRITSPGDPALNKAILAKISNTGELIWGRQLSVSPFFDDLALCQVQSFCEGNNGEIILTGTIYGDLNGTEGIQYGFVLKIDRDGHSLFNKVFLLPNGATVDFNGIFLHGSEILVFGLVEDDACPGLDLRGVFNVSLDYGDGSIKSIRRYCFPAASGSGIISFANYLHNWEVSATAGGYNFHGFLAEGGPDARDFLSMNFDAGGNFLNGLTVTDHLTGRSYHSILVEDDGQLLLKGISPAIGLLTTRIDAAGQIRLQSITAFDDFDSYAFVSEGGTKMMEDGSGMVNYTGNASQDHGSSIVLIHSSGFFNAGNDCLGRDTSFPSFTKPLVVEPGSLQFEHVFGEQLLLTDHPLQETDIPVMQAGDCRDDKLCTDLSISGPDSVCANSDTVRYAVSTNAGCPLKPVWQFDNSWMDSLDSQDGSVVIYLKQNLSATNPELKASLTSCSAMSASKQLMIQAPPIPESKSFEVCPGDSLLIQAPDGWTSYQWQDGSVATGFLAKMPGKYYVDLIRSGCRITDSFRIVTPEQLPVNLGADTTICAQQPVALHAGSGFSAYTWQDGSTDSVYLISGSGWYAVSATDRCGRTSSDSIHIEWETNCDTGPPFSIPNAFSPNGDGINERFHPVIHGNLTGYDFEIFDRGGSRVFISKSAGESWDGRFRNTLQPAGVYAWFCKFMLDGKKVIKKGTVVLIR